MHSNSHSTTWDSQEKVHENATKYPNTTEEEEDEKNIGTVTNAAITLGTGSDPEEEVEGLLTEFPEGGFGWFVVLGSFVVYFWIFGINTCFGIYQDHFLRLNSFNNATDTDISWVGSVAMGAIYLPGPFINRLILYFGYRPLVLIGILACSLGYILASFATKLWQLYLTQGLLYGLGAGLAFLSVIPLASQYFDKRRGFVNGIVVSGAGIGGLVLAPLMEKMISSLGVHWCQRITGFCILGFMLAVFPFLKLRVDFGKTIKKANTATTIIDWSLFKVKGFPWLWAFSLVMPFGYTIPLFLVPTYSSFVLHESSATGATLISVFAGVNAAARIVMGYVSDHVGRTNMLFVCCFMAGLSTLAIWSVAKNLTILTVFMVMYGGFGGGMVPVVTAQVVGVERLTAALGILYFAQLVGNLLGAPIATAIMRAQEGWYLGAILFAGLAPLVASFFVLVIRFQLTKKVFAFV
ncbi:hypothetical protein BGZ83_000516 [Gryganskiella cystojenkinii]|nr:hypothetical protein BGZ83_000516 [Gryganskiella cystojenkinii]